MTDSPAGPFSLRSYWPTWAGWSALAWFLVGPQLLNVFLGVNLGIGVVLGTQPWLFMLALFQPYPEERDTETGLLRARTRENWVRAWRKALTMEAVIVALAIPLHFWIQSLDLP